jgi:hypothetical protein
MAFKNRFSEVEAQILDNIFEQVWQDRAFDLIPANGGEMTKAEVVDAARDFTFDLIATGEWPAAHEKLVCVFFDLRTEEQEWWLRKFVFTDTTYVI